MPSLMTTPRRNDHQVTLKPDTRRHLGPFNDGIPNNDAANSKVQIEANEVIRQIKREKHPDRYAKRQRQNTALLDFIQEFNNRN